MYAEILKLEKMLNESGIAFCGGECSEGYMIFLS